MLDLYSRRWLRPCAALSRINLSLCKSLFYFPLRPYFADVFEYVSTLSDEQALCGSTDWGTLADLQFGIWIHGRHSRTCAVPIFARLIITDILSSPQVSPTLSHLRGPPYIFLCIARHQDVLRVAQQSADLPAVLITCLTSLLGCGMPPSKQHWLLQSKFDSHSCIFLRTRLSTLLRSGHKSC